MFNKRLLMVSNSLVTTNINKNKAPTNMKNFTINPENSTVSYSFVIPQNNKSENVNTKTLLVMLMILFLPKSLILLILDSILRT